MTEGWVIMLGSRREHYIVRGRSLCNRWLYFGGLMESTPPTQGGCKTCLKHLAKRQELAVVSLFHFFGD